MKPVRSRVTPATAGHAPRWLLACACMAALGACNTMPERDAQLENARIAHDAARDNSAVQALASVEYRRADDEYRRAEAAWQRHDNRETVDHLAYLAQRRAEIALETANLRASEAVIANAKAERDRVELEARTRDANIAQRQALVATRAAQAAEQQAMASQAEAAAASQRANESAALAQSLAAQLADLQTQVTNRGMVVTLGDVLFETGSARLREPGVRAVDRLATFMREHPERTVAVEGYTDSMGSEVFNQELSERRATTIRNALIAAGVTSERISVRGYGKAYPIASNGDATGRQMNRRVEVVISDPNGRIPPRG